MHAVLCRAWLSGWRRSESHHSSVTAVTIHSLHIKSILLLSGAGAFYLRYLNQISLSFVCIYSCMFLADRSHLCLQPAVISWVVRAGLRPRSMSGCQAFDLLVCTPFTSCEPLVFVSIHSTCQLKQGYKVCAVYTAAFGSQPRLLLEAVVFSAWLKPPATMCGAGGTLLLSFFSSAYFPLLLSSQRTQS